MVLLVRVFLRNSDRIEMKRIFIALGEPRDCLMPPGQTFLAVQAMLELPDDSVSQLESGVFKYVIQQYVKRKDFAVTYVIPNLPADRSPGM